MAFHVFQKSLKYAAVQETLVTQIEAYTWFLHNGIKPTTQKTTVVQEGNIGVQ